MSTENTLVTTQTIGAFERFFQDVPPLGKVLLVALGLILLYLHFNKKKSSDGGGDSTTGKNSPITKGLFNFFKIKK
ncbi:MAG: hypothetical protein ACRCZO_05745 [Cetobacterium sp.]